jgi:hypothetical protein
LDEFEKLTSKKEKIECVKEQILISYLGLGWEEAHHPWSKYKHVYTASELGGPVGLSPPLYYSGGKLKIQGVNEERRKRGKNRRTAD